MRLLVSAVADLVRGFGLTTLGLIAAHYYLDHYIKPPLKDPQR